MKLSVSLVALSAATVATAELGAHHQNVNARHNAYVQRRNAILGRQAAGGSSSVAPSSSHSAAPVQQTSSAPAGAGAGGPSVTVTAAPAPTTPTVAGTVIPPLDQITSGAPIETPLTMFTTFSPGATAPYSGAPALPTFVFSNTVYPELDVVPPTNSPQVQKWLSEIDLSGVPNLGQTVDGSCASDPAKAQDKSRCWWTCGGCTRDTDIVVCPTKQDWGVSYDDGPSPYTPKLINFLHQQNVTATFFVVGSRVVSRPEMLQAEYMLGHEISIHTWSHHPLTTLTNEQIVAEMGWTRQAIKDVIGVSPVTMRPPYGDIDDRVRAVMKAMGLTPVIWTGTGENEFDTKDWQIPGGGSTGPASFAAWQKIVATANTLSTGFITLQHDLYQQSVDLAVGYIVPDAEKRVPKFNLQSIIECLKHPRSAAYAELSTTGGSIQPGAPDTGSPGSGSGGSGSGSSGGESGASVMGVSAAMGLVGAAAVAIASLW